MTKTTYEWTAPPAELLRVGPGFLLSEQQSDAAPGFEHGKSAGQAALAAGVAELGELQERLWASATGGARDAVLLILQAMDTAGKGGIVRHVVGGVDPQGVELVAFKRPTEEELEHDFLWRVEKHVPAAGFIGVFDRSHYEDVLIGRVRELAPREEIERRYEAINDFEARLVAQGVRIVKVMLNVGYEEQRARLAERLDRPDKHWKYNPGDVDERRLWPAYMDAYQHVFDKTSTQLAPWHVVPADKKWYARLAVQQLLIEALRGIDPQWPVAEYDVEEEKRRLAAS